MESSQLPIPGLTIFIDILDVDHEQDCLSEIDARKWDQDVPGPNQTPLKRRIQQFGFRWNYPKQRLTPTQKFPSELGTIRRQLCSEYGLKLTQCSVEECQKATSIPAHIEPSAFGVILILTLSSDVEMLFSKGKIQHRIAIPPRSLIILEDEARWGWKFEIRGNQRHHVVRKEGIQKAVKDEDYRWVGCFFREIR